MRRVGRSFALVAVVALAAWTCDQFWYLDMHANVPAPLDESCVQQALSDQFGSPVEVLPAVGDTFGMPTTFVIESVHGDGNLYATSEHGSDSLKLVMRAQWGGFRKPPADSVRAKAERLSTTMAGVALTCWQFRVDPITETSW